MSLSDPDPALFQRPPGYAVISAMETLKELEKKLGDTQQ
jgi:hypothetical protein